MAKRNQNQNNPERTRISLIRRCQNGIDPVIPRSGVQMIGSMIDRVNGIDSKAWKTFYKLYYNFAYCVIRNKVYRREWYFSEDACREIAHDAVVNACDCMLNKPEKKFDLEMIGTVRFRTWFYYRILDAKNRYLRTNFGPVSQNSVEFDPETYDRDEQYSEFRDQLMEAIETTALELLAQSRINKRNIVAYQMYMQGRKYADITKGLGMSENTVQQAISRCYKYLAERREELQRMI